MKYFEKHGLKLSQMTLGTVQLGLPYGINNTAGQPDTTESFRMLQTAYQGGVSLLDTSDNYGSSEETIGHFRAAYPESPFLLCTKFDTAHMDPGNLYRDIRSQALRSMQKLQTDCLDIFMSHIETDYLTHGHRLTDALMRLKEEGLIRSYGISLQDKTCLEQIVTEGGFDAVQIPLNLFDCQELRNGVLSRLSAAGTAVFVRSVYLQGLFFKDPASLTGGLRQAVPYLEELHRTAASLNISIARLALSFIRDAEGVDSLVLGSENTDQITQNLQLIECPTLPAPVRAHLLERLKEVPTKLASPWLWPSMM